jgi:preprotein translocase subunit SecD
MFTAIIVTRVLANLIYENKTNLKTRKLNIWEQ